MDMLQAIKARRSCRSYTSDAVPQDKLDAVIEAGLWAASGMGRQSVTILAVTDKAVRDELMRANAAVMGAKNDPFYGAPVVLVVLANRAVPTAVYDGSLAIGNMMLEASALGLGSCWIHRAKQEFDDAFGKELLARYGVEGDFEGVGHVILGCPAGDLPEGAPRREGRVVRI